MFIVAVLSVLLICYYDADGGTREEVEKKGRRRPSQIHCSDHKEDTIVKLSEL